MARRRSFLCFILLLGLISGGNSNSAPPSHAPSNNKPALGSLKHSISSIHNATNSSRKWPAKLASNTSATNYTSSFVPRPVNISAISVTPTPLQDARNISDFPTPSLKAWSSSLGEVSLNKSLNNASSLGPTNISGTLLKTTLFRGPWLNGTQFPKWKNSTALSAKLVNASIPIPPLDDNKDLYPPTNLSYVTFKHNCQPLKFDETSRSRISRRLSRQINSDGLSNSSSRTACWERDADFFEFSEKNILESEIFEWYARWTVEVMDKKPQQYTEHGEWRMFYRWWLQEYDFRCGYDFSACRNAKNREDVQKMYPGEENRELVRRIYFVTLMYDYLHDHTKMMQVFHSCSRSIVCC